MRLHSLFAGFLCAFLVSVMPCAAASNDVQAHKVKGGLSLDLPKDWNVLDPQSLAKIQANSQSGPKILLAAETPKGDPMVKLTVSEAPGAFDGLDADAFKKLSQGDVDNLCKQYTDNLKAAGHKDAKCSRVSAGKTPALSTILVIPAAGNRPAFNSTSWLYPNGAVASVVTVLYMEKDEAQVLPVVKKIAESVVFAAPAKKK